MSVKQLVHDIESVINRHRQESIGLTYSNVIGALEMIKSDIIKEARGEEDEEDWRDE